MSPARRLRLLALLPVLVALGVHGWALGRGPWMLAIGSPVALGAGLGWRPRPGPTALVAVCLVGLLSGALGFPGPLPPEGAFPPRVLSALCGGVGALALSQALAGREAWSWGAALALVGLSAIPCRGSFALPGLSLLAALLGTALALAGRAPWRAPRLLGSLGFLALCGLGTWGFGLLAERAEGMLLPIFERLAGHGLVADSLSMQPGLRLGPVSRLSGSEAPILQARQLGGEPLRTQVMDRFDGQTWSSSPGLAASADPPPSGGGRAVELVAFTGLIGVVPAPLGALGRDGAPGGPDRAGLLRGALERGAHERLWISPLGSSVLAPPGPEDLAVPQDLAVALLPFARSLAGAHEHPEAKAAALEDHLLRHHEHSDISDLRGEGHPLVVMLREERPASCGYLASAMVLMLRLEGVPARVVGGFLPWDHDPIGGWTTVRQGDAHAWVEAWSPERGDWVSYDPTPVSFPEPRQGLGALWPSLRASLARLGLGLRHRPDELLLSVIQAPAGGGSLALALSLLLWRRLRGRRRRRAQRAAALDLRDPALWPLYRRYQRALGRLEPEPRPAGESDQQQLERLAPSLEPPRLEAAHAFLAAYQRARFGGGEARDAAALLRRFEGRERSAFSGRRAARTPSALLRIAPAIFPHGGR